MTEYHPKFIERWAKIYVKKYVKDSDAAINWAMGFFPSELIPLVIEQAKKEIKKRGLKPRPEPA